MKTIQEILRETCERAAEAQAREWLDECEKLIKLIKMSPPPSHHMRAGQILLGESKHVEE